MTVEDLQNKDVSILTIWGEIVRIFGIDVFTLVDFWDADNYSFGFKKGTKLIYVSTWKLKEYSNSEIICYCEFEIINELTYHTEKVVKKIDAIDLSNLIAEIYIFLDT